MLAGLQPERGQVHRSLHGGRNLIEPCVQVVQVTGVYVHGLFENDALRASLLTSLRRKKRLPPPVRTRVIPSRADEYDRLETAFRSSIDVAQLFAILDSSRRA